MTDHDDEALDSEQHDAATATDRAIAVLAGPGSGKTRTLAHRARHLLTEHPDTRALLLTFTNKAAAEMKQRALKVGNVAATSIDAGTFHAFGAQVLRAHGELVGIAKDFTIIDQYEEEDLAEAVGQAAGVGDLSRAWSKARLRREPVSRWAQRFGDAFEEAKRAEELVSFDDLVVYTAQVFEGTPELAAAYGTAFAHVLVDEFQDTNAAQFAIIEALAPHVQTVSIFADDDQAIMRFAGADAANIARFVEVLEAREIALTCNYRCREEIVQCANALVTAAGSSRRMSAKRSGGSVKVRHFASDEDEAEVIADEIANLVFKQDISPSRIAVLSRTGFDADLVVEELRERDVPVTDWRSTKDMPVERKLFIVSMSVLRPRLTATQATRLSEMLGAPPIDERASHAFLEEHAGHPVADELLALREQAFRDPRPSLVAAFAVRAIVAYDDELQDSAEQLVMAVRDFEEFDPNFTLEHLLVELALKTGGRAPTEGGGVKVATLHGTKGLQWPIVYMLGLDEGRLPFYRSVKAGEVADERRVCFVGVCRAEDRLMLAYADRVRGYPQSRSRFLLEMGL
jgi:superfamily I DNA/RNA helicase